MLEHHPQQLHRQQVGRLKLQNLAEGEWVYLNAAQIDAARSQAPSSLEQLSVDI